MLVFLPIATQWTQPFKLWNRITSASNSHKLLDSLPLLSDYMQDYLLIHCLKSFLKHWFHFTNRFWQRSRDAPICSIWPSFPLISIITIAYISDIRYHFCANLFGLYSLAFLLLAQDILTAPYVRILIRMNRRQTICFCVGYLVSE